MTPSSYTVPLFLVALVVGLAHQARDIYHINARMLGTENLERQLRRRSSTLKDATRAAVSWFTCLWRTHQRSILAGAFLLALLAMSQSEHVALLATVPAVLAGEVSVVEVKKALDEAGQLWHGQFKQVNEKIAGLEAKGAAVDPLLIELRTKLSEAIDRQTKLNDEFVAQQASINKLQKMGVTSGDEAERRSLELRRFNLQARSLAAVNSKPSPADITQEQYDEYREAFDKYTRRGEKALMDGDRKAVSVGQDSNGGYLVPADTTGKIVARVFETSPMRQFASAQAISTDALEGGLDTDEASFGWVGETASRSETSTPGIGAWRIPVHEAHASPKATQKLLEDANIDVQAWLARKVADKFGRGYNTAMVTGNGISKPRGFASYSTAATADASRAWGVFEHVATGSSGAFGTDPNGVNKLLDLVHKLKDIYAVRAAFYLNRTTHGKVRQLTDASSAGKYVFIPSFVVGQPDTLLGYPVRKFQDMADYTTADALAIAFGDMEETYQIVDRIGLTVLVDPFTAKPHVVFYTRGRIGGDVVNFDSMKFLKFGTS